MPLATARRPPCSASATCKANDVDTYQYLVATCTAPPMTTRRCCQEDQALNRLTHTRDSGRVRAVRMEIVATVVISTICWRGGRVRGIFGCSTGKWLGRCTDRDGFLILFLIRRAAHVADVYRSCVRAGSPKRFMIGIAPDQLKICRRVGGPIARAGWPPCNPVVGDLRACNGTDCFDRRFPTTGLHGGHPARAMGPPTRRHIFN